MCASVKRDELGRLLGDILPTAIPPDIGLATFTIYCDADSKTVLERARSVLSTVLQNPEHSYRDLAFWSTALPHWFVASCSGEWGVDDWLFWFQPSERQWFWWRAACPDDTTITVEVQPADWPFAHGAFDWLFVASGAHTVVCDDDLP